MTSSKNVSWIQSKTSLSIEENKALPFGRRLTLLHGRFISTFVFNQRFESSSRALS